VDELRSGLVAVVGRPNVGKSTLVNSMIGTKVTITSPRPGTTRRSVRGVLHREGIQIVFVDTPGLHKPRTAMGERMNEQIGSALSDVDSVVAVVDALAAIGPGDRRVLEGSLSERSASQVVVAVNKTDAASRSQVVERLVQVNRLAPDSEVFPVSARSGEGTAALVEALVALMPKGPAYFPEGMTSDVAESFWVAEIVREALLHRVVDELPHSIATRVVEWEGPYIRVEILVERESQKAIVIGSGGTVLKDVGIEVRKALPEGTYLELRVKVEPRWQQRPDAIERLGY
jgi:GTPase